MIWSDYQRHPNSSTDHSNYFHAMYSSVWFALAICPNDSMDCFCFFSCCMSDELVSDVRYPTFCFFFFWLLPKFKTCWKQVLTMVNSYSWQITLHWEAVQVGSDRKWAYLLYLSIYYAYWPQICGHAIGTLTWATSSHGDHQDGELDLNQLTMMKGWWVDCFIPCGIQSGIINVSRTIAEYQ